MMKIIKISMIMFCLFLITGYYSCENADLQKSAPKDSVKINPREPCDDCEDCDVDECCCTITLVSSGTFTMYFCGTECGGTECGPFEAGACDISGFTLPVTLDDMNQVSALFCMNQNEAFSIYSSTGTPTIRITCQTGQINPQTIQATLNTPGGKVYYSVNGDCELTNCL